MTSEITQRRRRPIETRSATPACAARMPSDLDRLMSEAVNVRMRRGQRIAMTADDGETVYLVVSGLLALEVPMPSRTRQILTIFRPGDLYHSSTRPGIDGEALRALSNGELKRIGWPKLANRIANDPALVSLLAGKISAANAALARHLASIGGLSGPQRVSTFLLEEVTRSGEISGASAMVEIVPSRIDTADYLALNPDTLSRIFGTMQDHGLLQRRGRNRYYIPNVAALSQMAKLERVGD